MSSSIGELSISLKFDEKSLSASASSTQASLDNVADAIEKRWGVGMAVVQNVAVKAFDAATSAVSNFASSALNAGMTFDSSMANVAAISGASADELALLTAKAQEMGATTKFTATEAADGLSYMAMAGWKTEDMLDGLAGIMSLAAAGGADLAETSDIVTDALTAFGEAADQSGRLADIMAAASSNSNTNIHLLGETFKYVAPVAGALNYSMEDTAAAIGLMANAGIKGSQAGTALRTLLTNLTKPTDAMAAAMEKLGISVTDASGQMKPMSQLTGELREAFSGLSEAEKASYAATIAGQEGMSGLLAIVNAAPEDYDKLTQAINGSAGAAQTMADTMLDNLPGQMTLLSAAFEGVQLSVYKSFLPALTQGAAGLGDFVGALGAVLSGKDPSSKIADFVDNFGKALFNGLSTLGSAIGKVAPVLVRAIVGLLPSLLQGALGMVTNLVEEVAAQLPGMVASIVDALLGVVDVLTDPGNIEMFINAGLSLFMAIVDAIPIVIITLTERLPLIIQGIIDGLLMAIPQLIQAAITLLQAIVDAIPQIIPPLLAAIPQVIQTLTTYLLNPETITLLFDAALQLFMAIVMAIPNLLVALIPVLPDILMTIIGFLLDPSTMTQLLNAAVQLFLQLVLAVPKILGQLIKAFGTLVGTLWENIKTMFGKFAENFGTFITDIFKGAINGMISFIENFLNTPIGLINGFIDIINGAFGWLGVNIGQIPLVALPRLQYGGIIPGDDYSGDHVLARVNSGEMVLTRGQQGALWNAIESGQFGSGVPAMPEPATASLDAWAGALAQAFADDEDGDSLDERPIYVTMNNEIDSELDADEVGNLMLESIRRSMA